MLVSIFSVIFFIFYFYFIFCSENLWVTDITTTLQMTRWSIEKLGDMYKVIQPVKCELHAC